MSRGDGVLEDVLRRLVYLGYDASVTDYLEVTEDTSGVRVTRYPTEDDYNGVSASLLRILIRDIDRVVEEMNREGYGDESGES